MSVVQCMLNVASEMESFVSDERRLECAFMSDRRNPRFRPQLNDVASLHGLVISAMGSGRKQYFLATKTSSTCLPTQESVLRFVRRVQDQEDGFLCVIKKKISFFFEVEEK